MNYVLKFLICLVALHIFLNVNYSQVPEATTGFRFPLNGNFSNNGGYQFLEYASYSGGNVYHPAEDWNQPTLNGGCSTGCSIDRCLDVMAVANGKVVYKNMNDWGGIVIQHNYQGQTWYSQYGHIINAEVNLQDNVTKGQKIAEIGNEGTTCAHLHFEIRESDHPQSTNGGYWVYGNNGLGNINNVNNWYEDPDEFIPSHPAYNGSISCTYTVNNITLSNGWKFWKNPPIPTNYYNVTMQITNLPSGSNWALYTERNGVIIDPIATNQSSNTFNFTFAVNTSNPSYPNGGGYKFRLTPQGQSGTIWCNSSTFFISSLPTIAIDISPSSNLQIGSSATVSWVVSGGIPGELNGGWTGNIRLQWYQNNDPKENLAQIPVANNSYTFTVPSSLSGATIPGCNFKIAGVNAETGTSIPGGYISAFTDTFCIVAPLGINIISQNIPKENNLSQNYPNPFNPLTQIEFDIAKHSFVKLTLYDIQGKELKTLVNQEMSAGTYSYTLDGSELASGIYIYKLETDNYTKTQKMILSK